MTTPESKYLEVCMPQCRCPVARWQHVDIWLGECQLCGRELEFSIKMEGDTGRYFAYWNRHDCEAGSDGLLVGEVTWLSAETLTSLRGAIATKLVKAK